jgi:hypothetical protein
MESPFTIERRGYDRSQKQAALELTNHGLFVIPAENNVVAGIQRVSSWLRNKQLWFVKRRCPKPDRAAPELPLGRELGQGRRGEARARHQERRRPARRAALRVHVVSGAAEAQRRTRSCASRSRCRKKARWAWERLQRIEKGEDDSGLNWNQPCR